MSPRKKKDLAAELAHNAAIAHAIESTEKDLRGAPETNYVDIKPGAPPQEVTMTMTPALADPIAPAIPEPTPERPCALEHAPIGAKCVVSRTDEGKAVRLLTPAGVETLDKTDLMYILPPGAKIRKAGPAEYEAYRLGVQEGPLFTVKTARIAVQRFLEAVA